MRLPRPSDRPDGCLCGLAFWVGFPMSWFILLAGVHWSNLVVGMVGLALLAFGLACIREPKRDPRHYFSYERWKSDRDAEG